MPPFLTYAANRSAPFAADCAATDDFAGLFADTISRLLENHGYTVAENVGCVGFRIDIVVEHPKEPGVYLAGILCDGPYYWSSEVARDHAQLRVQILGELEWNLIRIRSTEWYQHPASCTKTLLDALDALKTTKKKKSAVKAKTAARSPGAAATAPPKMDAAADPVTDLHLAPYTPCGESSLGNYHQFASVSDSVLGTAIVQIVSIEGPVSANRFSPRGSRSRAMCRR